MKDEKFFGSSVIGERGQIVVPAKAREELDIKAGDEFIFFGHGQMLHMIKASELNTFLDKMTAKFSEMRKSIKKED
ncbi:MAG: AbrB/MazE/SpoVT family DNA-binding domain-containing protein [Candidatus Berkelbacteria bacterium]